MVILVRARVLLLSLVVVCLFQTVDAQDRPMEVEEELRQSRINRSLLFNYDLYNFAADHPDSSRLGVVVSLVNDLLQFVKHSDSLYAANFELTFTIINPSGELVFDNSFRRELSVTNYRDTNSRSLVHSYYWGLDLIPGKYELQLELMDLDIRKSLQRKKTFEVRNFYKKPVNMSSALLATARQAMRFSPLKYLERERASSRIARLPENSRLISPFPIGGVDHYRVSSPVVVFCEFYQQAGRDTLSVQYRLSNSQKKVVWQEKASFFSDQRASFDKQVELNPSEWEPGLYVLEISARKGTIQENKKIRIYFSRILASVASDTSNVDEIGPLRYILSDQEYEYFTSFPGETGDSLMAEFWDDRDPTPFTPVNELREEFIHRIRFANRNFVSLARGREGWQTDQGRVYILNGPPSEIFHPTVGSEVYQHEVWVYNSQQLNMRFVFVFKPGKGEYELLSSG